MEAERDCDWEHSVVFWLDVLAEVLDLISVVVSFLGTIVFVELIFYDFLVVS